MNSEQLAAVSGTARDVRAGRNWRWSEVVPMVILGLFVIETIAGVGIGLLVVGGRMLSPWETVAVSVRNETGHRLTGISVRVQEKTVPFPDLEPGKAAWRLVRRGRGDGDFTLSATRANGSTITVREGYITGGYFYTMGDYVVGLNGVTFSERYY